MISEKSMLYKKNCTEVFARLSALYGRKGRGRIYATIEIDNPELRDAMAGVADGACDYPDLNDRLAFWDRILRQRADVEDDSIPICYCSELDQGLASGLFGAPDVRFVMDRKTGWVSSMASPFLKGLEGPLALDRGGLWAKRMREQYRLFAAGAKGKFAVAPVCTIEGLNFLIELRGAANAYLDLMDGPAALGPIMDQSIEAARFVNDAYFNTVGLLHGGTPGYAWQWSPGRTIMDSVDAYHMTGEELFHRWGKPYFERLASYYDGSHVHIHANAYRMIPYVAKLKGLVSIHLGDDPYNPPAMDRIWDYDGQRGDVPLIVPAGKEEFRYRMQNHDLPGNVLYLVQGVQHAGEANDMMRMVKEYRI